MDKEILQRIILILYMLSAFKGIAVPFSNFVSLVIIDTLTGNHESILLEVGEITHDEKRQFEINVRDIEADEENPHHIAWVNLSICYRATKADAPLCVQRGKLCTSQLYYFQDKRYILAFDVLMHLNDD